MTNANKDISPESLNTLIVYREPSYYASPIQPPVSQHRCCNIYIFTPLFDRTLEGHPFICTAATKVHALLKQDCLLNNLNKL